MLDLDRVRWSLLEAVQTENDPIDGLRAVDAQRRRVEWNALPREIGAATTVYDRFREWERDGFFERLWVAGLQEFDEVVGIDWEWLAMDRVMTKAPFGGAATGANPTDRGKRGTKRSRLSEGHALPMEEVLQEALR